jgi:electron transfer flavoprotein alpha subunit
LIISIGVSGAPQHVDYIGERATIIAFNKDADAPLMTLNKRRGRPKVVPILGDLFETVPQFTAALRP